MPQINPMEGLQTLLRLRAPSHVQTGDPWLARRQSEIASGLDELLPDADSEEYMGDQLNTTVAQIGRNYTQKGAEHLPVITTSRDSRRSGDMAKLKQVLGFKNMEHEADIAKSVIGQQAQMDRILAAQGAQNYRTQMQQEGSNARSEADRAAREAALEARLGSMETQQAARDAAAMERTRAGIEGRVAAAEARKPKDFLTWLRSLVSGGNEEVAQAPAAEAPQEAAIDPREERRRRYGY